MEALIDFAIVTALRVEREAIVRRLDSPQIISEPDVPYTYYRGRIGFPGVEGGYEIVVLQLLDVGNVDAAASAATLIHRWSPQFLLMLGIAGGVAQSGIEMGDVAVSRYVHYYEPGKRKEEGEERRPKKFSADRVLFGKANAYEASEWKDGVSVSPPGESNGFVPKAFFGPIASGELVISDSKTVTSLIAEAPKLIAVAMEGAGVAQAAENASIRFLEIRGISDMADPRKSDSWHEYAANAAAAFAVGFLKTKPVSTAAEARLRAEGARQVPVLAIRAQSQTLIRPDELLPVVQSRFRGRDIETTLIDLMPDKATIGDQVRPEEAVRKLLDLQGELAKLLARRDEVEFLFHGLLHIPFATLIGFLFSDRLRVRMFDFHPTSSPPSWSWPSADEEAFPPLEVRGMPEAPPADEGDFLVRFSVSYSVSNESARVAVPNRVAEIDVAVPVPMRGIVRSERQVREYGRILRSVLDDVARLVRTPKQRIHVFYAGPVSLAFYIGQIVSESIHPPVLVWNYRRGYEWAVDLAAAGRGEVSVEWTNSVK